MDGWNTFSFPFGFRPIFKGEMAVKLQGGYTTQLYGDYFISQYKDPYINQSANSFQGGFFGWLVGWLVGWLLAPISPTSSVKGEITRPGPGVVYRRYRYLTEGRI